MHNFLQIFAHQVITKVSHYTGNIKSRVNCWNAHTLKTQLQAQGRFFFKNCQRTRQLTQTRKQTSSQQSGDQWGSWDSAALSTPTGCRYTGNHEFHNMLALPNMFRNVDPFIRRCREIWSRHVHFFHYCMQCIIRVCVSDILIQWSVLNKWRTQGCWFFFLAKSLNKRFKCLHVLRAGICGRG